MHSYLTEKFGNNEFFFVYGDLFKQVEESQYYQEELNPRKSVSYYEKFLEPLRTYEAVVVGGRTHYVVETRFGKVICPGSCGMKPTRDSGPISQL